LRCVTASSGAPQLALRRALTSTNTSTPSRRAMTSKLAAATAG
jgi:hypothetical protein